MGNAIRTRGVYERQIVQVLTERLPTGARVLDIGANIVFLNARPHPWLVPTAVCSPLSF